MSNQKAAPPIPIQPKPISEKGSAGASGQMAPVRKQRAGPLVFVNSSDVNTEGEKRGNRKMVKKWAMLNRNSRHLRPTSSQGKAQFLSWDLRADRETSSASPETDDSQETKESQETALTSATEGLTKPPPPSLSLMGEAVTNQFNNLSVEADPHAKDLIEWFLKGGRGDVETPGGRLSTCNRLAFPMIAQSPAALCSLIAALESNPFSPIRTGHRGYRDHWLAMALANTNSLLQTPKASKEVFMCVSFLMWIGHHTGDFQALRVHISGYAALMVQHWDLFCSTPYFRNGPFFWTFASNEGNILPETRNPPAHMLPTLDMENHINSSSLVGLQLAGYLSSDLILFLPYLLAMQAEIPNKAGQLSVRTAKDLLTYIWYNARTLTSLEDFGVSRLEQCVQRGCVIFYYACLWRNPRDGVGWLVGSMQSNLTPSDLSWLMREYPEVLMWLTLLAGHFATDFARDWWLDLLVSVRQSAHIDSFEKAREILEEKLLWTRWLDQAAESFWNEATSIMKGLRLPWEKSASPPP